MIEGARDFGNVQLQLKAAQEQARYESMSEKQIAREIKRLEKQMLDCARKSRVRESCRGARPFGGTKTQRLRRLARGVRPRRRLDGYRRGDGGAPESSTRT